MKPKCRKFLAIAVVSFLVFHFSYSQTGEENAMKVTPFTINVPQEALGDLQHRLANTRWPDEADGAGWDYGTNLGYMKELVDYWQNEYDWREQEGVLNTFAHFKTEIDGFGIHFIHEKGKGPNPTPLLLLHGWPDSFYRFYKIIPMLTDPASYGGDPNISFDVIVPSLPGFGFSDKPTQRGGVDASALFIKLMTEVLGYKRFGVHGGDTGSPIAQFIAMAAPEAVIGMHLTDVGWHNPLTPDAPNLSEAEKEYLAHIETYWAKEGAYASIQGTKPQSLAYGLNDSPVGLAAWIVEQFRKWSDNGGDIENSFSKDELLTNIMIYWVTETINSSIRGYYDGMNADWSSTEGGEAWGEGSASDSSSEGGGQWEESAQSYQVPAGLALFPADNPPPRETAERSLNVQRWTEMPKGGHFAALEEPELLVQDISAFFNQLR